MSTINSNNNSLSISRSQSPIRPIIKTPSHMTSPPRELNLSNPPATILCPMGAEGSAFRRPEPQVPTPAKKAYEKLTLIQFCDPDSPLSPLAESVRSASTLTLTTHFGVSLSPSTVGGGSPLSTYMAGWSPRTPSELFCESPFRALPCRLTFEPEDPLMYFGSDEYLPTYIESLKLFINITPHLDIFKSIENKHLYKLFIDQKRWKDDRHPVFSTHMTFDVKEPGYTKAMMKGFEHIMHFPQGHFLIPGNLNAAFLEQLHRIAVTDVSSCRREDDSPIGSVIKDSLRPLTPGLRREHDRSIEAFGLKSTASGSEPGTTCGRTVSPIGIRQLLAKFTDEVRYGYALEDSRDKHNLFSDAIKNYGEFKKFSEELGNFPSAIKLSPIRSRLVHLNRINQIISVFHQAPKSTEDEKLLAISRLVQDLDQIHPFYDGNIRLFGILLLHRLLFDLDLSPSCLEDPNCLDCLSLEEIVMAIKVGQHHFQALKSIV